MSDTLYLSLWYPNLRLAALADKLTAVLSAFAAHGGEARVYSATVWPVNWSEPPVFQQVYGRRIAAGGEGVAALGAEPRAAVKEALELLHAHADWFAPLLTHTRTIERIDEAFAIASQYRDGVGKMQAYKGELTETQIKDSVDYFRTFLK